jgi:hypothetical protein
MNKSLTVFFIILVIYWIGLFPFFKAAHDLPYSSLSFVLSQLEMPTAWNSAGGVFGQNQLATLWSWPNNMIYSLGAWSGMSFGWLISLIGIFPVLLVGYWGMYLYSGGYIKSLTARSFAGLFFLANSYIVLVIDGGQLLWAMSYALIPWCLYFLEQYLQKKKFFFGVILSLVFLSFSDLRAVFLLVIIFTIQLTVQILFIRDITWSFLKNLFYVSFFGSGFLCLIHAYWLIPLIFSSSSVLPSNLVISSQSDFLSFISLGHALVLQQPHWYKNIFGQLQLVRIEFLFSLVLLVPLFSKSKLTLRLLILLLVGVFLVKGNQPPFGGIYSVLVDHIPGFFLFRDSSKFFVIIALVYSVLCGLLVEIFEKWRVRNKRYSYLAIMILTGWILGILWPVYTGQMTGLLGFLKQKTEYAYLEKLLSRDQTEGRVLWIPSKPPLGFMDPNNIAINGVDLVGLRPFATGIKGTYETLNYLREASFAGELLAISGVKKMVYALPDPNRDFKTDEKEYYQLFLKQLQQRQWIKQSPDSENILNLSYWQPSFSIPENYYFVVGSDLLYVESTKSADFSLVKNGLIFLEEKKDTILETDLSSQKLLLYKKNPVDLMMTMVPSKEIFYPSEVLDSSPNQTGWWSRQSSDYLSFRDFLIQKYQINISDFDMGGGWAISEGEHQLTLPVSGIETDIVMIRLMESTRSASVSVFANNKLLNRISTNQPETNIRWQVVGQAEKTFTELILASAGDINIINAIAVVPKDIYEDLILKTDLLSTQITKDFTTTPKSTSSASIIYKKLNDDQYRIDISNLQQPSLVVFNQRYDPKWTLNGQSALPVYSIFNGFIVKENGSYLVEYEPHRYMFWSGFISIASLLILVFSVVYRYYVSKINKTE